MPCKRRTDPGAFGQKRNHRYANADSNVCTECGHVTTHGRRFVATQEAVLQAALNKKLGKKQKPNNPP